MPSDLNQLSSGNNHFFFVRHSSKDQSHCRSVIVHCHRSFRTRDLTDHICIVSLPLSSFSFRKPVFQIGKSAHGLKGGFHLTFSKRRPSKVRMKKNSCCVKNPSIRGFFQRLCPLPSLLEQPGNKKLCWLSIFNSSFCCFSFQKLLSQTVQLLPEYTKDPVFSI